MNEDAKQRDEMTTGELVAWAWRETPPVHENRTNLMIHLIAVPLFAIGHIVGVIGIVALHGWLVILGLASIVVSLILQKYGHSLERNQAPAFSGARDFIRRIYAEQFCNFWRYLFSGQWYASFKRAGPSA